ncbi:MAG: hypothetical protein GF344_04485, partial [Chitinivibrionales bacterium]|nr:hypothetical protein [Chitinivibrionales bacterium]MBD3356300.1 hypothetical protein [Chitinivibrionales bacterium]
MLVPIAKAICIALFAISCFSIFVEVKTKFNKSLLWLAGSIIILSTFSAFDLWYKDKMFTNASLLNAQHVIFSFFPPFLFTYVLSLKKNWKQKWAGIAFLPAPAIAALFLLDIMVTPSQEYLQPTNIYTFVIMPYLVLYVLGTLYLLVRGFITSYGPERNLFL